jgi:dethiobiotin synthetase
MARAAENVAALRARLPGPCLGVQDFLPDAVTHADTPPWLTLPKVSILE